MEKGKKAPSFAKGKLVKLEYRGIEVNLNEDGWFNATKAAELYGKKPHNWLKLKETRDYIERLCRFLNATQNHIIKTKKGKYNGGTWLHPRLAVPFARWLDMDFAIWCDDQIDKLLRGNHPHFDWKRMRHEASSSFKVMNAVLQLVRQNQEKPTKFYHYVNESKLINWVVTGEFKAVDREALETEELGLLAKLEERNAVMLGCGLTRDERKLALTKFVSDIELPPAIAPQSIEKCLTC